MKLLVGLGNPGEKYKKTRHNVGFMVVDTLASQIAEGKWQVSEKFHSLLFNFDQALLLAKPNTFMNSSGEAIKKLVDFYKIELNDLYVIHDDLDIKLGEYKIQKGKGPKLHGGVNSIEEKLGTQDFWRVRVGVENRQIEIGDHKISGDEYVLQKFPEAEKTSLNSVIHDALELLPLDGN